MFSSGEAVARDCGRGALADRMVQVGVHGLRECLRSRSMRDLRSD